MGTRQNWIRWATFAGLLATYVAASELGLSLASVSPNAMALWAPAGIALAALLLLGYWVWPAILLGAFLVNVTTTGSAIASMGIAVGNTLEGLVGAYLVNRFAQGRQAFDQPVDVFKFVVFARLLSPIVGATLGVTSLAVTGLAPWADYAALWFTWWMRDGLGALIIAPLLILWGAEPFGRWPPARTLETGLTWSGLALISLSVFAGPLSSLTKNYPLEFLCVFPILWAAFRLGRRETATAILILAMIAIWGTFRGDGPLVRGSQRETLLVVQVYIGVITIMGLVVSANVALRRRIESALQGAYNHLEREVQERTYSLSQALQALQAEIAERKQTEEALRQQTQLYESVLSAQSELGDGVAITEGTSFVYLNAALCQMYGYSAEEIYALPSFFELIVPEDRARLTERLRQHLQGVDTSDRGETAVIRKDGRRIDIEYSMKVMRVGDQRRMFSIIRDITERKQVEEELRTNEERRRLIIEGAYDAFVAMNTAGVITAWNRQAEIIFGWPRSEAIGRSLAETLIPERYREAHRHGLAHYLDTGEGPVLNKLFEMMALHRDGHEFPVELTVTPLRVGTNHFFYSFVHDVTERKQAEAQLRASLEEKEVLLKEIHHRVKNNLQVVSSLLKLQAEAIQDPQVAGFFQESRDRVRAMGLLHERLYQSENLAHIDLEDYVRGLVIHLSRSYSLREVKIQVAVDNLTLDIERAVPFGLIINELVSNSLKHAFEPGQPLEVRVIVERQDDALALRVSDNGVGLPDELDLDHLHSMGLQLVKSLCTQLHGALTVTRQPRGTLFTVTLPEEVRAEG